MFAGINEAFITGDMAYMLNGVFIRKIVSIAFMGIERIADNMIIELQTINFIEVVIAYSCNDYKLLEKIMPFEAGPEKAGCIRKALVISVLLMITVIQLRIIIWFMP